MKKDNFSDKMNQLNRDNKSYALGRLLLGVLMVIGIILLFVFK